MPTKKAVTPLEIKSLARAHSRGMIKVLAGIAHSPKATDAARVTAAQALLDRGLGKPGQAIEMTVEDRRDASEAITTVQQLLTGQAKVDLAPADTEPTKH